MIVNPCAWRALPYTDDPAPWRRLACAMLLGAAVGAHAGDAYDVRWIASAEARTLADLVGLPVWPPRPEQLASLSELRGRAREGDSLAGSGAVGTIRSRNPADKVKSSPWRRGPAVLGVGKWRYGVGELAGAD